MKSLMKGEGWLVGHRRRFITVHTHAQESNIVSFQTSEESFTSGVNLLVYVQMSVLTEAI